jgi:putative intracellular protease/amidase
MAILTTVAMILTSHGAMDNGTPTGAWLEEIAQPYFSLQDREAQISVFSILGGLVPIDPHSLLERGKNPASVERFLGDADAMHQLEHSRPLATLDVTKYEVLFTPGGHGTMWDFPDNAWLGEKITQAWARGAIVASLCHGPASLIGPTDISGKPLVAGKRLTCFTDHEERAAGLDKAVPFMLERRLRSLGAHVECGPNFMPHAIREGRLITGQNPQSSAKVAELAIEAIKERLAR